VKHEHCTPEAVINGANHAVLYLKHCEVTLCYCCCYDYDYDYYCHHEHYYN